MGSNHKVAVLGAGIVGLSTALELQNRFPSCDVTIIAEKFFMDTTSDGAAGVFEPSPKFMGPDLETTSKWIRHSYEHYSRLLREPCGVKEISGYSLSNYDEKCVENHYLKHLLPVYRRLGKEALAEVSPGDWKYGTFMSTLSIPSRVYLPWAMNKFKAAGGKVLEMRISSFSELGSEFNLMFNCTGLGAAELCDDPYVIPVRGQVIRIQNPSIDKFYISDYGTYIIPNCYDNFVTLGGTQNLDHWNRTIDPFDSESILDRCGRIIPALATFKGRQHPWVGLRPYRYSVRVEYEGTPNVKIKNTSINNFYSMHEKGSFIVPSTDGQIILGGAHDFGTKDLRPDPYTRRAILARTAAVRPEISASLVDSEWVGLWAYRGFVRVELELVPQASWPQIIHNYGHGGYGVTSAPGTARAAVDIFEKMHKSSITA